MGALRSPFPAAALRRQTHAPSARRAYVPAHRSDGLAVDWKPLAGLETSDWNRWRELAGRALQPNVFYEPAFARAAANLPWSRGVGALLVRSGSRLIGALAGRVEGPLQGRPIPTFVAWAHPYAPLSTPLLDREAAETAVAALLHDLPLLPGAPRVALFPLIDEDGPVARLLADHLYRRMRPLHRLDAHARAALVLAGGDPLASVPAKKLKELGRQRRRLAELGALDRVTIGGEGIEAAVSTFLELEASGWKGRIGGAAAAHPETARFLAEAVAGLAREGKARVDLITLDRKPLAATIALFSGDRAWFWKTAYDERYAHFSPGVLGALALTEDLGRDQHIARVDSCAIAHHPMIDHLWSGRQAMADWLVALSGSVPFRIELAAERLRRTAYHSLKALRDRLRGPIRHGPAAAGG